MTEIIVNNCVYKTHPIYTQYAASRDGYIIHITKQAPSKGIENNIGYLIQAVWKFDELKQKTVLVHKLVWETFNGEIPAGKEIDHIDNDKKKITSLIIFSFLIIMQIAKKQLNLALI